MNHYQWLNLHFEDFLRRLNAPEAILDQAKGLIIAHGDKCYSYENLWKLEGIPFPHGVAIYLISFLPPWNKHVRENPHGFVAPYLWVIKTYPEFKLFLKEV